LHIYITLIEADMANINWMVVACFFRF